MIALTPCIKEIFENGKFKNFIILQVIDYKNLPKSKNEIYKAIISDGINWNSSVIFSSQANQKVKSEEFKKNSIISINSFQIFGAIKGTASGESRVLIINEFDVVSFDNNIIGNPEEFEFCVTTP